jgi:hypothetical protein
MADDPEASASNHVDLLMTMIIVIIHPMCTPFRRPLWPIYTYP